MWKVFKFLEMSLDFLLVVSESVTVSSFISLASAVVLFTVIFIILVFVTRKGFVTLFLNPLKIWEENKIEVLAAVVKLT